MYNYILDNTSYLICFSCSIFVMLPCNKHFSSINVLSLKDSPKIFIVDASGMLSCLEDMLYVDPNFNEARGGNEQLHKFKFHHPHLNMLELCDVQLAFW